MFFWVSTFWYVFFIFFFIKINNRSFFFKYSVGRFQSGRSFTNFLTVGIIGRMVNLFQNKSITGRSFFWFSLFSRFWYVFFVAFFVGLVSVGLASVVDQSSVGRSCFGRS